MCSSLRAWIAPIVLAGAVFSGCAADDASTEARPPRVVDTRPLVERSGASSDEPASLSQPWWRRAAEASPATEFRLDGEPVDAPDLFVVGEVLEVIPLSGLRAPSGASMSNHPVGENLVPFGSPDSYVDLVGVKLGVTDGVGEGGRSLPETVVMLLPLAAPTDVESLAQELEHYEALGAVVFESPAYGGELADTYGAPLYEILDFFYLGPIRDGALELGVVLPPDDFHRAETVAVVDMLEGAGVIEVTIQNGVAVRLTDES